VVAEVVAGVIAPPKPLLLLIFVVEANL